MANSNPKVGRTVWNNNLDDSFKRIEEIWAILLELRRDRTDPEKVLEAESRIKDKLRLVEQYLTKIREIGDEYKEKGL